MECIVPFYFKIDYFGIALIVDKIRLISQRKFDNFKLLSKLIHTTMI